MVSEVCMLEGKGRQEGLVTDIAAHQWFNGSDGAVLKFPLYTLIGTSKA